LSTNKITLLEYYTIFDEKLVGKVVKGEGQASILRIIEDQPDQEDQPVELGFPLGYALSWGFPPSSPSDRYFIIFLRFFIFFGVMAIFS